ncbi:YbaK/EbsC family protein [Gluconacetobacter sp.]|uniref:YbaK/EbsC family protein n=1 Tax=Gluconacetobacter sp. TaxID=1935994 RepID=UPI0039E8222C
MSLESVRAFLAEYAPELDIIELDQPTATVAEAAAAHGTHPAQIAKTISLRLGEQVVLVVAAGTARLDNRKTKEVFGHKPRMLDRAEVESLTGHPVGGVCPFGLPDPLPVYCDVSLRAFETVLPAAGAINSAVRLSPDRLAELTHAVWVDICQART